jgi:hypothetical protein
MATIERSVTVTGSPNRTFRLPGRTARWSARTQAESGPPDGCYCVLPQRRSGAIRSPARESAISCTSRRSLVAGRLALTTHHTAVRR